MDTKALVAGLKTFKIFFDHSTSCLTEEDSSFSPVEGLMTAAQMASPPPVGIGLS